MVGATLLIQRAVRGWSGRRKARTLRFQRQRRLDFTVQLSREVPPRSVLPPVGGGDSTDLSWMVESQVRISFTLSKM